MPDPGRQTPRSPHRSKVLRMQKIQPMSPIEADPEPVPTSKSSNGSDDKRHRRDERNRSASNASSSGGGAAHSSASSSTATGAIPSIIRSHTPGHLATKSRRKPAELSIRQRSPSTGSVLAAVSNASNVSNSASPSHLSIGTPPSSKTPGPTSAPPISGGHSSSRSPLRRAQDTPDEDEEDEEDEEDDEDEGGAGGASSTVHKRPSAARSTSAIASKPGSAAAASASTSRSRGTLKANGGRARGVSSVGDNNGNNNSLHGEYTASPPLADPKTAVDVLSAPSSGMYWSRAPVSGVPHTSLRAHTTTIVGSNVFVFGGCDARTCFNDLYVLDADSFHWTKPHCVGEIPLPLRAMTCTAVGKKLVVFGGGDGPEYYNDVYVLDTTNFRWSRPKISASAGTSSLPSKRRAHTACVYKNAIYVFGGGDGVRALNDVWRLDVGDMTKMSWRMISGPTDEEKNAASRTGGRPKARGYHTANMVGSKLIIFGGSDGGECFNDVWVYDVETFVWRTVTIPVTYRRLSHTATLVGSYLFVVGGHDGSEYTNDVLLLNLVTMSWDRRKVYGQPPTGRGYHGTVLYDSRLLMIGGFDGTEVFGDVWMLELAVHAYYSQISHFSIEV